MAMIIHLNLLRSIRYNSTWESAQRSMSVVEEIRNDPEKGVKRLECEYKAGLLAVFVLI